MVLPRSSFVNGNKIGRETGGLSARSWPTLEETNELVAQLRAGWLKPYRPTRKIPLQHTGVEKLSTLAWMLRRCVSQQRLQQPAFFNWHWWSPDEQEAALEYRHDQQRVRLRDWERKRITATNRSLIGMVAAFRRYQASQAFERQIQQLRAETVLGQAKLALARVDVDRGGKELQRAHAYFFGDRD